MINALSCGLKDITVKDSTSGLVTECIPCASCPEGQELYPRCGSQITQQERGSIECKNCKPEHYSDEMDIHPCKECHNCLKNQIVIKECTNISDTICHTCDKGYYFEKSSLDCEQCSCCCGDFKDVRIDKCISDNQPVSNQCSSHRAQKCCKTPFPSPVTSEQPTTKAYVVVKRSSTDKNKTTWMVVCIAVACISFVIVVIIAIIMFWKYRDRGRRSGERNAIVRNEGLKVVLFTILLLCGKRWSNFSDCS